MEEAEGLCFSSLMSQTGGASPTCSSCGAPDAGDFVICRFCKQAVSKEAAAAASPCPNPQCRALCRWGKQKCGQCQAWIVVSCVYCGAISPHNISNCMQCNEAFAGAAQRKALQTHHQHHQQAVQTVNVWGGVAASFLGAAAGSVLVNSWDSSDSCSSSDGGDTFDVSDVSDDTGFDFGGDD